MTADELNGQIKNLISKMEEVGARPSYTKGGRYNDFLEYGRLKDLIAERCIEAFRAGLQFSGKELP